MTAPPQPGWYDDPQNSNAQRYWDGQNWTPHRQRKNATPQTMRDPAPVAPPPPPPPPVGGTTPSDGLGPYMDKVRPHVAKGQQFWSGLSQQSKIAFAVGGLVVIAIVVAFGVHVFGSTDGSSGSTAAVNTSSQSYQMGLATGTNGQAAIHAYGGFNIATNQYEKVSPQEACEGEFKTDNAAADVPLSKTDYMAGCLYGIDHNENSTNASHAPAATVVPPSKKGPNGSTIPNRPGS